jgi:hypothetical protein
MKLRPWVKVALAFIIGVTLTSQIFKITGSEASEGTEIVHGVISINLNGESHIKHIDGAWETEIVLDTKEDYLPMEVVTVVLEDGIVVNDYLTQGDELDVLEEEYGGLIQEYRQGIMDVIFE